jgi:hypothetical protein
MRYFLAIPCFPGRRLRGRKPGSLLPPGVFYWGGKSCLCPCLQGLSFCFPLLGQGLLIAWSLATPVGPLEPSGGTLAINCLGDRNLCSRHRLRATLPALEAFLPGFRSACALTISNPGRSAQQLQSSLESAFVRGVEDRRFSSRRRPDRGKPHGTSVRIAPSYSAI